MDFVLASRCALSCSLGIYSSVTCGPVLSCLWQTFLGSLPQMFMCRQSWSRHDVCNTSLFSWLWGKQRPICLVARALLSCQMVAEWWELSFKGYLSQNEDPVNVVTSVVVVSTIQGLCWHNSMSRQLFWTSVGLNEHHSGYNCLKISFNSLVRKIWPTYVLLLWRTFLNWEALIS